MQQMELPIVRRDMQSVPEHDHRKELCGAQKIAFEEIRTDAPDKEQIDAAIALMMAYRRRIWGE